ncbi:MAG: aminotransferase class V-fold PLP-dependent enzyme [Bacteroidota bacterium]|nr:aminotransferase class V-fold PLP-dependent enzyme [Bacteroidota bacterium]MDP4229507.1 aminotransferase class V-fold PLP-dependent enzyme [Bacteroidota bacterium]MDP4235872.1 aminotransferase class V-fold PLP-dependent enzyme [Bacteroidota bacterium]
MNLEDARGQFPHTWTDMVYINHAAISPLPFVVRDAVDKYLERRALKGIEFYPWAVKIGLETKHMIADLLHTKSDRIAFTLNTAEGVSLLAAGIDWKEGDRILLYRYEYPANVYPYLNQRRHGVEIDFMEPADYRITLDVVKKHVTPKTRLLALSFVQFLSGFRSDLEAIGKFCREHNIIFAVDAIQGLPHSYIDVEKSNIDFLAAGSHKWLMGTEGTAFVYIGSRAQELIHQSSMGASSVMAPFNFFDFDIDRLRTDAGRYENGTMNFPGITALNAALKFHGEFGFAEIQKRVLEHSAFFISRFKAHGVNVLTPEAEAERAAIISIEIENPDQVLERLLKRNIIVAVRGGKLRFSPHYYNTEEELRLAVNAVFE